MKLLRSTSFIHAAQRAIKKHPHIANDIQTTLELLSKDAFNRLLKTHKLKGDLKDSWACSVSYEMRIIFKFVEYKGEKAILLETMGSHEEVY